VKIKNDSRLARAAAIGLGAVLIGGLSLAVAAPAQAAAGDTDVYTSDIALTATPYAGWHVASGNGAAAFTVSASGLELHGPSQIIDGYTTDEQRIVGALEYAIGDDEVSWTSTGASDPAFLQIPVSFDSSSTILSPVAPTAGVNAVTLGDSWTTSAAIGSSYAAGATGTLGDLLTALDGEQNAVVTGFGVSAGAGSDSTVTGISWMNQSFDFLPGTRLTAGTVAITGTATVGSVLTATPAGWPSGTSFSYGWYSTTGESGGSVGTDATTYTVDSADVGSSIGVIVTATLSGFAPTSVYADSLTAIVTAAAKPAAPAPVADSSEIAAYLTTQGVTEQPQTAAGLPAGDLNPGTSYTATLNWTGDSYVDVYAYSTPTYVGTFAVVGGKVQITLSSALLRTLAAGSHTLLVTGQTSGTVQAVSLTVGSSLAFTGTDPTVPLTVAALLLLLGATLVFVRRRLRLRA
jgi:LPXTG-motif cell wall-anchored protein